MYSKHNGGKSNDKKSGGKDKTAAVAQTEFAGYSTAVTHHKSFKR